MEARVTRWKRPAQTASEGSDLDAMARKIAEAGFPLRVWARRAETLEPFAEMAVEVAPSLSAMGADCDLACVCVRNDDDAEEDSENVEDADEEVNSPVTPPRSSPLTISTVVNHRCDQRLPLPSPVHRTSATSVGAGTIRLETPDTRQNSSQPAPSTTSRAIETALVLLMGVALPCPSPLAPADRGD